MEPEETNEPRQTSDAIEIPRKSALLFVALPILTFLTGYFLNDNQLLEKQIAVAKDQLVAPTATARPAAATSQPSPKQAPPPQASDHVYGSRTAPVTLIEYSDLECPYCKRFDPTVRQILQDYRGKVAWVYRHFPLSFHANAEKEAEAAECAAELGGDEKYYQYIGKVFERTTSGGTGFPLDGLAPLAGEIRLDKGRFKDCLDSGKYASTVQAEEGQASQAGVSGTPGTFVVKRDGTSTYLNGAVPYAQVKQAIDIALK